MPIHKQLIYLASQSPRRAELLKQIGVNFETLAVTVDETPLAGEAARDYVQRLAVGKACAGWQHVVDRSLPDFPVLGADTSVVVRDC